MPCIRHGRPITRGLAFSSTLGPTSLGFKSASTPKSTLTNVLLRQLIKTCIEQIQNHPAGLKDIIDKPLRPCNLNLYYGNLHIQCYYFCQQCENHIKITRAPEYKSVYFTVGFLKDCILIIGNSKRLGCNVTNLLLSCLLRQI